jgi:hypothetical protein
MSEESGRLAASSGGIDRLMALGDTAFVAEMLARFEAAGRPSDPAAEARLGAALELVVGKVALKPSPRR